jgi:hypothetical protein
VRKRVCACAVLLILGAGGFAATQRGGEGASPRQFYGTWTGTWDGAGSSGGFELTLEEGREGAAAGRVSVTGEPTYKATLKTLAFDGKKLSAIYDFPPDDQMEVALAATFDDNTAKGTWLLRGKNGGAEVVNGGWSVTKK